MVSVRRNRRDLSLLNLNKAIGANRDHNDFPMKHNLAVKTLNGLRVQNVTRLKTHSECVS